MITIYGKDNCKWCEKARGELLSAGINFQYINLSKTENAGLIKKIKDDGFTTVPAIYDDEFKIGGYEDLLKYLSKAC